jgi:hypothetical protein
MIKIVEDPPPPTSVSTVIHSLGADELKQAEHRIDAILEELVEKRPRGNGGLKPEGKKGRLKKLTEEEGQKFKAALIRALEHGAVWASQPAGLPNSIRSRGKPPDNSILVFIDDIMRACKVVGLKPSRRYAEPVSLPVRIYKELAPILWPVSTKAPRKVFDRWYRNRPSLNEPR